MSIEERYVSTIKKIEDYNEEEMETIFGSIVISEILKKYNLDKIDELIYNYEQKYVLHPGDVCECHYFKKRGVIVSIDCKGFWVLYKNGEIECLNEGSLIKVVGEHIDLEQILEQL